MISSHNSSFPVVLVCPNSLVKGDWVLLYQSRMGHKKPNLKVAWLRPYQVEWVYTNGITMLKELQRYFNPSKLKIYKDSSHDYGY